MDRNHRRDPRVEFIKEQLRNIKKVIAIASAKGGVGKSCVASLLAIALAEKGIKTGLLDLDIWSPSTHLILGIKDISFKEDRGIVPPVVHKIRYLSIVFYEPHKPIPLRGRDASEVITELLTITRWEDTETLIIDMPPGISDPTMDVLRFIKNASFVVVTTPSILAFETIKKLISFLRQHDIEIKGVIENMTFKIGRAHV